MWIVLSLRASKNRDFGVSHLQNSSIASENTSGHVNAVLAVAQEILFHSTVLQASQQATQKGGAFA